MEKQPSSFRPVIGGSQLVAPAKEDPELLVRDQSNSHHLLELADVALGRMKRNRATVRKHMVQQSHRDRKSTRLNSSHSSISYAVFCLKKKRVMLPRAR